MAEFTIKAIRYAGIGEPPADGTPYSRQDGNWIASPGASGGEANTLTDQGTGTGTLAGTKAGVVLGLKTLAAGANVTITNGADEVTIAASGSGTSGASGSFMTFDNKQITVVDGLITAITGV